MAPTTRQIFERYVDALGRRDLDDLAELHHADFVEESPQSNERVHGFDNWRAIVEHYPGEVSPDAAGARLLEGGEAWAVTPAYQVVNISGSGDFFASTVRIRYPDGTWWYAVTLAHLKDGRIWRTKAFWAPEYDAPAWRQRWAERLAPAAEASDQQTA